MPVRICVLLFFCSFILLFDRIFCLIETLFWWPNFYLFIFFSIPKGYLVSVFKQPFLIFKQHFTYFNALFHLHVFLQIFLNNNFQFLNIYTKRTLIITVFEHNGSGWEWNFEKYIWYSLQIYSMPFIWSVPNKLGTHLHMEKKGKIMVQLIMLWKRNDHKNCALCSNLHDFLEVSPKIERA